MWPRDETTSNHSRCRIVCDALATALSIACWMPSVELPVIRRSCRCCRRSSRATVSVRWPRRAPRGATAGIGFSAAGRPDLPSQKRSDTFTGGVWGDPVVKATDGALVNNVLRATRPTHRHRHERGQLLVVSAGAADPLARRSGDAIRAGDVVWIPPGEEHWHGAERSTYLLHMASRSARPSGWTR